MQALIVEDESPIAALLEEILEDAGYTVLKAENGKIGWDLLQKSGPVELALVDWQTPVMNGMEFLKAALADARFANTKFIMVTGLNDMANVSEALQNGVHEYLMKPFTPDMVYDKLRICGLPVPE